MRVAAALDLGDATVTGRGATPNATGVGASVGAGANAVVVPWDDADAGADVETPSLTVAISDVTVDRADGNGMTATVDPDGAGGRAGNAPASRSPTAPDPPRSGSR